MLRPGMAAPTRLLTRPANLPALTHIIAESGIRATGDGRNMWPTGNRRFGVINLKIRSSGVLVTNSEFRGVRTTDGAGPVLARG